MFSESPLHFVGSKSECFIGVVVSKQCCRIEQSQLKECYAWIWVFLPCRSMCAPWSRSLHKRRYLIPPGSLAPAFSCAWLVCHVCAWWSLLPKRSGIAIRVGSTHVSSETERLLGRFVRCQPPDASSILGSTPFLTGAGPKIIPVASRNYHISQLCYLRLRYRLYQEVGVRACTKACTLSVKAIKKRMSLAAEANHLREQNWIRRTQRLVCRFWFWW